MGQDQVRRPGRQDEAPLPERGHIDREREDPAVGLPRRDRAGHRGEGAGGEERGGRLGDHDPLLTQKGLHPAVELDGVELGQLLAQ